MSRQRFVAQKLLRRLKDVTEDAGQAVEDIGAQRPLPVRNSSKTSGEIPARSAIRDRERGLAWMARRSCPLNVASSGASLWSQAIRDFLAATSYRDETLIKASVKSLFEAMTRVVQDIVKRELEVSDATKKGLQEVWREQVDGVPCENLDEVRKTLESFIDEQIAKMANVRDGLVRALEERDYRVENKQQLEHSIRDLRTFRENILKDWPSSSRKPAPLNRQAIAEARAAIARGEKGMRRPINHSL